MVIAGFRPNTSFEEVANLAQKQGAYDKEDGWIHDPMIRVARRFGLSGFRIDYSYNRDSDLLVAQKNYQARGYSEGELEAFTESFKHAQAFEPTEDLLRLTTERSIPVITSMKPKFTGLASTHLIVLKGIERGMAVINDPWEFGEGYKLPIEDFENKWTKRAIVIFDPGNIYY